MIALQVARFSLPFFSVQGCHSRHTCCCSETARNESRTVFAGEFCGFHPGDLGTSTKLLGVSSQRRFCRLSGYGCYGSAGLGKSLPGQKQELLRILMLALILSRRSFICKTIIERIAPVTCKFLPMPQLGTRVPFRHVRRRMP